MAPAHAWRVADARIVSHLLSHGRMRAARPESTNPALDINSFTPVRMLVDRVATTEVLQYQHSISPVCGVYCASAPHTCWLHCDSSYTVGLTPHICKANHGEPCYEPMAFITIKPSVATESGAPGHYAGHRTVPAPDCGCPPSTGGSGPARCGSA